MCEEENPRKWNYTWEAQSHLPILKLFLFNPNINPKSFCINLIIDLHFEKSLLKLTWKQLNSSNLISLFVPLPRVLVDLDSPVNFRVLDDHIEVKIILLLSVDHPIVSSFIDELRSSSDRFIHPLSVDSDLESVSSKGDVDFYCRSCGFKLTKAPVRCSGDLPSVNWTDVADNWFGGCCSSFGGISEKMVDKYVKSYKCMEGTCLLTTASVVLCKDDVVGFKSPEMNRVKQSDDDCSIDIPSNSYNDNDAHKSCSTTRNKAHDSPTKLEDSVNGVHDELDDNSRKKSSWTRSEPDVSEDTASVSQHHCCTHDAPNSSLNDQVFITPISLQDDQKSFLNCYLGNAFIFRSSGLSKDIEWINVACPNCSSTLGAFPSANGSEPLDGGIRLLKCYITISRPSDSTSNLFSKYTLERMFSCQLLESAKDELSFRTVVKDLKTKSPMLHIVLLNPSSWCCTGSCFESSDDEQLVKINLQPVAKVFFSNCNDVKSELRITQEWELKNQADEIYMLTDVIREMNESIERAKDMFPPSFSSSQAFTLSSILR